MLKCLQCTIVELAAQGLQITCVIARAARQSQVTKDCCMKGPQEELLAANVIPLTLFSLVDFTSPQAFALVSSPR